MTHQERITIVHDAIKRVIKECPFTFENLSVEIDHNPERNFEMIVRFNFNRFGNNNKALGERREPTVCDTGDFFKHKIH